MKMKDLEPGDVFVCHNGRKWKRMDRESCGLLTAVSLDREREVAYWTDCYDRFTLYKAKLLISF